MPGRRGLCGRGLPGLRDLARGADGRGFTGARELRRAGFTNLRRRGDGDLHGPVALLLAEPFADQLFHLIKLLNLVNTAKGDGPAVPAGTARAADPVDIGRAVWRAFWLLSP